jgi:hypothetical protein
LLNDLFGIQSRGGCSCAGPYGHALLGIDDEHSHDIADEVILGCEGIKPGWIRVNFNYFISDAVFDFIVEAVNLVATLGWKLLPWYRFDAGTATWEHVDGRGHTPFSLLDINYSLGEMSYDAAPEVADDYELASYITDATELFESLDPSTGPTAAPLNATASFEDLRWFLLPEDVRGGE